MSYKKRVRYCEVCGDAYTGQGRSLKCKDCRPPSYTPNNPKTRPCSVCGNPCIRCGVNPKCDECRSKPPEVTPIYRMKATWVDKAKELRAQGMSMRAIGDALGVSRQRVCQVIPGRIGNVTIKKERKPQPKCPNCGEGMLWNAEACARCSQPTKPKSPAQKEYAKRRYYYRLEHGLCTACGKKATRGTRCDYHAEQSLQRTLRHYHGNNPDAKFYKIIDGRRVRVDNKED